MSITRCRPQNRALNVGINIVPNDGSFVNYTDSGPNVGTGIEKGQPFVEGPEGTSTIRVPTLNLNLIGPTTIIVSPQTYKKIQKDFRPHIQNGEQFVEEPKGLSNIGFLNVKIFNGVNRLYGTQHFYGDTTFKV